MVTQKQLSESQPVYVESEDQEGIVYRLPPYDDCVKNNPNNDESDAVQVMLTHENGEYDTVVNCTPDELTLL